MNKITTPQRSFFLGHCNTGTTQDSNIVEYHSFMLLDITYRRCFYFTISTESKTASMLIKPSTITESDTKNGF